MKFWDLRSEEKVSGDKFCEKHSEKYWKKDGCFYCKEDQSKKINEEGSELLAEVFNLMTKEQKESVPEDKAKRIGEFMFLNGYRFVFDRWYLQAEPINK